MTTDTNKRRPCPQLPQPQQTHLVLTPGDPRVVVGDTVLYLSRQSLTLLQLLAEEPGRVVSTATLAKGLTRARTPLTDAAVAVHVYHLRAQLRPTGLSIRTIRRSGYLLEASGAFNGCAAPSKTGRNSVKGDVITK